MTAVTYADRFWSKADRSGGPDACWPWLAATQRDGYGIVKGPDGRSALAHRVAYALVNGPVPADRQLDHLCRTRICVNPAHTEPVTPRINILRGYGAAALNARKTTCPRGHRYDRVWNDRTTGPTRRCSSCERTRGRARRAPYTALRSGRSG